MDHEPLPTMNPGGPMLCEFLAKQSVRTILGRDDVSGQGYMHAGSAREAATAECRVFAEGAADPALTVTVLVAHSAEGEEVLRVIAEDDPDYLFPPGSGPGYGFVQDSFQGVNGVEGNGGAVTRALRGDSIVQVAINDQADGRDALADAVALTQQIATALDLPTQPSSPYPTP